MNVWIIVALYWIVCCVLVYVLERVTGLAAYRKMTSSNIKYIDNQLVTVIKIQMICKCKYKTI